MSCGSSDTMAEGINITQLIVINAVSLVKLVPRTLKEIDEVQGIQWTKMSVERREKCSSSN